MKGRKKEEIGRGREGLEEVRCWEVRYPFVCQPRTEQADMRYSENTSQSGKSLGVVEVGQQFEDRRGSATRAKMKDGRDCEGREDCARSKG